MAYKDFTGELIADFPTGRGEINDFAKEIGINTEGLTIIGFRLDAFENHPDRENNKPEIKVILIAVPEHAWENDYNTMGEYWQNEDTLKVLEFDTGISLFDFHAKYLKRFEGILLWPQLINHKLDFVG